MIRTNELLKSVLTDIEMGARSGVNSGFIAKKHALSEVHLQRLFKLKYNKTLGIYIRTHKLTESIDDLLNTDLKIVDIALDYGFEYEQSYIRAFKREFGITPGKFRKSEYNIDKRDYIHEKQKSIRGTTANGME